VKFIHSHLARNPVVHERFRAEISRVAVLQHPNIVESFDFGEHDGRLYVTMELMEEGSLRTLLQRRARSAQTGPAELRDPLILVGGGVTNSSGAFVVTLDLQRTNVGPYTISVRPRGERTSGAEAFTINQVGTGRTGLQPIQPHIRGNLISSDQITCEVPGTPTVTPAPTETGAQEGEEGESGEEEEEEE
jgi:hypothetical protein